MGSNGKSRAQQELSTGTEMRKPEDCTGSFFRHLEPPLADEGGAGMAPPRGAKRPHHWSSSGGPLPGPAASGGWAGSASALGAGSSSARPWHGGRPPGTPAGARGGRASGAGASAPAAAPAGSAHEGGADPAEAAPPPRGAVCAVIESRAREVGLAFMHRRSMEFEIAQFCDNGSYSRTTAAVLALEPLAVVASRTSRGTQLFRVLDEALAQAGYPEPTLVDRRFFDETEGHGLLEEADVSGLQPCELPAKFVACAALAALWRFAESAMELHLQAKAVSVVYRGAADVMAIDANTARLLELVVDARGHKERNSMFSMFACRTPGGARLLRQSLLQPPAVRAEIEARQDAVQALLADEALFFELQRLLPAVGDLDLLAARLTVEPKTRGQQWCKAAIRTAVRLRHALAALPLLAEALKAADGREAPSLLGDARAALLHSRFPGLLQELDTVLDGEGPPLLQGQGSMAHAALMYAVRPSVSALLDIARQTWNDALEQIHSMHRSYAAKYPEMNIRLEFTDRRGWYFSHTAVHELPADFFRTAQKGTSAKQTSTTRELSSENFKLRQAEREILMQTVAVLNGLYEVLRVEAPLLYRVSHAASTLDLIQAFVGYALLCGGCVRPELTEEPSAPIAVKGGRHPLMERILSQDSRSFEPLDFFIGEACHFQAVTGPNAGGKSTYLQTVAQLVVLAQIGCFIPARYATVRVVSSLFTRIGSSDSIEASASTFLLEMQEATHIIRDAAPESLVLIDELGRGTAHADGVAICWAVCERLIELKVYTLFATHFFEICRLQAVFPGFRNIHLRSTAGAGQGLHTDAGAGAQAHDHAQGAQNFAAHQVADILERLQRPWLEKRAARQPEVFVGSEGSKDVETKERR
ncbi:unnamed protein product [Prorocentrum cordatum]|uniref:DNA mismatch repair proteins mutS family domain-containing protein n=1 Tax=Prorocentrum cordatum TaxID=2364126 RepID=A0ABN9R5U2_9DINO|nr:unnamed protein product [Polarella glacialis]